MKRYTSRVAKRRLQFDQLEVRKLLAAGDDFYELKSDGDFYADKFFQSTADPVIPSIDTAGQHTFDFSVDRPGDQTADITFAKDYDPATRIRIDPTKSYQFAFIGYEGEGAFVVEPFSSSGQSLGQVGVPYVLPAREGLNYFRYTNVHAMIGPAGQQLPAETAWIDFSHSILPASTRTAANVAVMDLVFEPIGNRSDNSTFSEVPRLRTPKHCD